MEFWARGHADISIHAPLTGSDEFASNNDVIPYNFNPRSPYGERPSRIPAAVSAMRISIHAPLTGSDRININSKRMFNISIHAPLTGSDVTCRFKEEQHEYFNPRSPYGERRCPRMLLPVITDFNPRSPYGERPFFSFSFPQPSVISIHAPLTGSDSHNPTAKQSCSNFNPRSPYGERQQDCTKFYLGFCLSSTIL